MLISAFIEKLNKAIKQLITLVISFYIFALPIEVSASNIFLTSYSFDDAQATSIASKYYLIATKLSESSAVTTIKNTNPQAKIIHYDNALTHGDDYYVYDTVSGNRIVHDDWGWYLHDISDANYRASLANFIASNLATYSQFDGVFLDDCWYNISASVFHQEGTSDDPSLPQDLIDNWRSSMISLLQEIKTAIGSKLLILNCGWYASNYFPYADGIMDENFAHANWEGPNEFLSVDSWKNHLNALNNVVASSKYYLAQSGVSDGATQGQINKLVNYCYSSFLMGIPANNAYGKHYFCPSIYYTDYYWYSFWEINLGNPTGDYFEVSGITNCFRRDFDNGIVLVNPTDNATGNFDLGGTFYTLDAVAVTQANLSAREGLILFNNEAPTDIGLSSAIVAENQPVPTEVGTFSTIDPDPGDTHTYSLVAGPGADDNASFTISGDSLRTADVFDYETKNTYYIRVQTDDGNGGTYEEQFVITVTEDVAPPSSPTEGCFLTVLLNIF
jgi:hypothetical protein